MRIAPRVVFFRVNAARIARGREPLRWDRRLARIADDRARRAARIETHPGGLAGAMSGRWESAGEALAWIPYVMDPVPLWLASPDHRALVLDRHYTHGGVGIERAPDGWITISLVVADRSVR